MRISIITACFNYEATLDEAISSINQHTFRDWEHGVIDGASGDETLAVVDRFPDPAARSSPNPTPASTKR